MGSRASRENCIEGRATSARETHWGNLSCTYDFAAGQTEDDIGNTLSEVIASPASTTTYTWDRDDRLLQVTPPAPATPTTYEYGANGLRVQRVDAAGTTNYLLDGRRVLAELDAMNAAVTRFLSNPQRSDDIITFERGGATYYPLTDALGSIYAVADASGAVVRRYDFDVYGVRTDLGGTGPTLSRGFTGREHDADDIRYHRDRYARGTLGRWMSPDPAKMIDGPNVFSFVGANPVRNRDPSGRVILAEDERLFYAKRELEATVTGAPIVAMVESSSIHFRLVASNMAELGTNHGQFGGISDSEEFMCGQTAVILIRINVERIGQYGPSESLDAIPRTATSPDEFTETIEQRTLAGAVFHELMHALQYTMIYEGPIRYPASPFRTMPPPALYQSSLPSRRPPSTSRVIGAFDAIKQNHEVIDGQMERLAAEGVLEIP